jgi:hypothetical protein
VRFRNRPSSARCQVVTAAICFLVVVGLTGAQVDAQGRNGAIAGTIVTATDGAPLPGADVRIVPAGRPGSERRVLTGADGRFLVGDLPPGTYEVRAVHPGFDLRTEQVELRAGETRAVRLALAISGVQEAVSVQPAAADPIEPIPELMTVPANLADVVPLQGDDFISLIPTLPGVIRRPDGRLSLSGGRPEQSGLQVSEANVTDPVTGNFGIDLPLDAVESVTRFNSSYAAEYGRFASGLVRVETRRSDNTWRASFKGLFPTPRLRDGKIRGVSNFSPRVLVGGPLVRDRLFLTQSLQYERRTYQVKSVTSGTDLTGFERFSSFSRFDLALAEGHDLVATVAVFPRFRERVTLDTFNPESVTPNIQEGGFQIDLTERSVIGSDVFVNSSFIVRRYDVDVLPQQDGVMRLTPDGRQGSFFHREERQSRSYQWIETFTRAFEGRSGTHLVKAGFDMLHSSYDGVADNGPVEIRRADGTLAERIEFPGRARIGAEGTDLAFFVQDRWRASGRVLVDLGIRLDRDAVLERAVASPRVGASISVFGDGRGIVRGGFGTFASKTPLNIATFEDLESRTVTRYDTAGRRLAAESDTFVYENRAVDPPKAYVWSIGYDHKIDDRLVARFNYLRRRSRREFIINPEFSLGSSKLFLDSTGRSDYKEVEFTLAYTRPDDGVEAVASYVVARANGDFNSFDRFYGDVPTPIIQPNAPGPFDVDVPRRFVFRGMTPLRHASWLVAALLEVRTGFPYSALSETQRIVGAPNSGGRFPMVATLDFAVSRLFKVRGRQFYVGIRAFNLFNRFTPRDVQNNLASPAFGSFYNGIDRRISLTFQANSRSNPFSKF